MRNLLIVFAVMMTFGCGPGVEHENKDRMSEWKGKPVDRLIYKWGAPDSDYQMANGKSVLTFENEIIEDEHSYDEDGNRYVSGVHTISCRVDWYTNEDRTIVLDGKSSGDANACHRLIVPL